MLLSFTAQSVSGEIILSDEFLEFIIWLSQNNANDRAKSLCVLLANYDKEQDQDEKRNILKTLIEILENKSIDQ